MRFVHESVFQMRPERLFELHARPEALRRLSPSFPPVRSVEQSGPFESGTSVRIEIGIGPITLPWHARLEEVEPGRCFVDVQERGPFKAWRHIHRFLPAPGGCLMRDVVTWEPRAGLGLADRLFTRRMLRNYFIKRHSALREWVIEENSRTGAGDDRTVEEERVAGNG